MIMFPCSTPHLFDRGIPDTTEMTFLSRLSDTSSPRLPAFPFTLIRPFKKSSCYKTGGREGGEGGRKGGREEGREGGREGGGVHWD